MHAVYKSWKNAQQMTILCKKVERDFAFVQVFSNLQQSFLLRDKLEKGTVGRATSLNNLHGINVARQVW